MLIRKRIKIKMNDFLVNQWLRVQALSAGGLISIPIQGKRSQMPQWRFPCVATKTWHSQINKKIFFNQKDEDEDGNWERTLENDSQNVKSNRCAETTKKTSWNKSTTKKMENNLQQKRWEIEAEGKQNTTQLRRSVKRSNIWPRAVSEKN